MEKQTNLIDIDKVLKSKAPVLYKWLPSFLVNYIKRIVHQKEVNEFIDFHSSKDAIEFSKALRERFEITVDLKGLENIPCDGSCIVVSNHPLGGLDAIALIPELRKVRADIKYIVNDILLNIAPLKEIFLGVNKVGSSSRESLRKIEEVFNSDQLVVMFPAGLVSRRINGKIVDLEWQKTFAAKAKKHNTPVVPIYIEGTLTNFFYRLSNIRKKIGIKANIEMLYLTDEMFKQQGKTIKYRVGKPIYMDRLEEGLTNKKITKLVRQELYKLADN